MAAPLGLETREQRAVFFTYIGLWVGYGLLNELAKRRDVHFNSTSAVVVQSFLKLGIATHLYLANDLTPEIVKLGLGRRVAHLWSQMIEHKSLLIKYFIPSGLYVVYDVLSYVNLRRFDAPTYFLLLQFRMVITGVLHQFMFQKKLNRNQWISLVVTTLGCAVKTMGATSDAHSAHGAGSGPTLFAYGMLFVQMLSSTFAGVYNEVLLKKQVKIPLNLQNIFMYLDSIICTFAMLLLGLTGQSFAEVIEPENIAVLFSFYVLPMVLIMSFIGVVTSMFLKTLDSIRKAIASALELVVLPVFCAVLFGVPLTGYMVLSVICVASGVYIYSLPVSEPYAPVAQKDDDLETGSTSTTDSNSTVAARAVPTTGKAT